MKARVIFHNEKTKTYEDVISITHTNDTIVIIYDSDHVKQAGIDRKMIDWIALII